MLLDMRRWCRTIIVTDEPGNVQKVCSRCKFVQFSELTEWMSWVSCAWLFLMVSLTVGIGVVLGKLYEIFYFGKFFIHSVLCLSLRPYFSNMLQFNCTNFIFCYKLSKWEWNILSDFSAFRWKWFMRKMDETIKSN